MEYTLTDRLTATASTGGLFGLFGYAAQEPTLSLGLASLVTAMAAPTLMKYEIDHASLANIATLYGASSLSFLSYQFPG